MEKLTQNKIKKLKEIASTVEDMIDFDTTNSLNLIQIFKRLSLKQIDFLTCLNILDDNNISSRHQQALEISKLSKDLQNTMLLLGLQQKFGHYIMSNFQYETLNLIAKTIQPYIKAINKTHHIDVDKSDMLIYPSVISSQYLNELKSQIYLAYIENPDEIFPIENLSLKETVVSSMKGSLKDNERGDFNIWYGNLQYNLERYFTNYVDNDMKSKSDKVHESNIFYNETIDKIYNSASRFNWFSYNGQILYEIESLFDTNTLKQLHFKFEIPVPEGLTTKEFYTILWLDQLIPQYEATLPSSSLFSDLAQLIYLQTKDKLAKENNNANKKENLKLVQLSDAMLQFLQNYNPQVNQSSSTKKLITHKDFREFIDAIETNKKISQNIIDWLVENTSHIESDSNIYDNKFITRLLSDLNIATSLSFVENEDEKKDISNKICDSNSQFVIKNVYRINNQKTNTDYKKDSDIEIHHKTLVHGTSNASILTILRDGLLTRSEIKSDALNTETGLGLGDGVYFAQCYQAGKSLNYTGSGNNNRYLFIADVAYSKEKAVTHFGNYDNDDNWDLLFAKAVGNYDRDELVSRTSKQIELKYLLEIQQ